MMEKVTRERDYRMGRILSMPTIITASKRFYKQRSLKVTKINLLQWAGQKCNEGKLTKLWMEGKRHKRRRNTFFVTKRH